MSHPGPLSPAASLTAARYLANSAPRDGTVITMFDPGLILESLAAPEIEWMEANAFDLLRDWSDTGRRFDAIVLDPPAFAKTKRALPTALRGYKELNLRALKMLEPEGILVTCSCSHHVSQDNFLTMLAEAARDAHRRIRLLEVRGQSQDHPVVSGIPETAYLKCVIAYVE